MTRLEDENKAEIKMLLQHSYRLHDAVVRLAKRAGVIEMETEDRIRMQAFSSQSLLAILRAYFKIDFIKKSRLRKYVDARHIACYVIKKYTKLTLVEIAALTGAGNHTTVMHGIRKIAGLIDRDPLITYDVAMICSTIEAQFREDQEKKGASQGTITRDQKHDPIKLKIA